jgi:hypothetical protein
MFPIVESEVVTMKPYGSIFVIILGALGVSAPAQAQVSWPTDCGVIIGQNDTHQYGDRYSPWLEYVVSTSRGTNIVCPISVTVTSNVVGLGYGDSNTAVYAAILRRPVALSTWGHYQVDSQHSWNWLFLLNIGAGSLSGQVDVRPLYAGNVDACVESQYTYQYYEGDDTCPQSPLLLDMHHDGFRLTSARKGVRFDIAGTGVKEQIAWTEEGSDDAWLAFDRNGNGVIDDGTELFGNHTPVHPGKPDTAANGFAALRFYEGGEYGPGLRDEMIDANDSVYSRLLLWTDRNHNGFSEPEELQPVCESTLLRIHTNYKETRKKDRFGNEFRQRALGEFSDGTGWIFDVWLLVGR